MDPVIKNTSIAGSVIFGVMAILTMGVFLCFVGKGLVLQHRQNRKKIYHFTWLNSVWIYLALSTIFLLLTLLYCLNAVEFGFFPKPNLTVASWLRWLILTLCGVIHMGILAFVMTREENDDPNVKKQSIQEQAQGDLVNGKPDTNNLYLPKYHLMYEQHFLPAQSLFIVFFYGFAYICIYFSTVSLLQKQHIVWMVASVISFILSIVLFFFPYNKFCHTNSNKRDYIFFTDYDDDDGYGIKSSYPQSQQEYSSQVRKLYIPIPLRKTIIMTYRSIFLIFSIVSYILYFIIWFLSESNDFSTMISQDNEFIANLVIDYINFSVLTMVLIIFTYSLKQKVIGYIRKQDNMESKGQTDVVKASSTSQIRYGNGVPTTTNTYF